MTEQRVTRGKPAEYGQEIVKRRSRITAAHVSLSGRHVLDFGAGNGAQSVELLRHGCTVVACDIDSNDLGRLKEFLRTNGMTSVTPVLYDGTALPFADGTFDVVVSYAVLEHVENETRALTELHRVLSKGGHLLVSVPNKWWVFETHGARLPLLPWNRVPFFSWLPEFIHSRYALARIYTRRRIIRLLQTNGFEILRTTYITAPMDVVRSPSLQKLLRTLIFRGDQTRLPVLATEVFVSCRKCQPALSQ